MDGFLYGYVDTRIVTMSLCGHISNLKPHEAPKNSLLKVAKEFGARLKKAAEQATRLQTSGF